ncbi:DUF1549 domain-containing protein [Rhodopirellula sp. MGV]|uniref:DUF1549 domain-containing protein n=1 Tax=Rhodopirellula sp. MGV TaxID=2023130 RepID=UPI000B966422|nr:DUF1549 domain-containing protein [Rhodopirellula sp. MGV]OYP36848.1 S-layer protein [Rhodopirellula sp. MGV]PNY36445.1 DUF1553 domain-containing protein [Rhodopirellula baltica]
MWTRRQHRFRFPVRPFAQNANRVAFIAICLVGLATVSRAENFKVLPSEIQLRGASAIQHFTVVQSENGSIGASVAGELISIKIDDDGVVNVSDGVAQAIRNGQTTMHVTIGEQTIDVPVSVVEADQPTRWSFRNDVQSVLAKAGCSMGACHGALAGKGGFRLSLRGYDPQHDYLTISKEARGRRIELADPGRSLILAKPTGALPHKGGLKLRTGSREYDMIAEWIAQGAEGPSDSDARLQRISVLPDVATLAPGDQSQILVSAHYDDGSVKDVTHLAKFSATDESVARVDQDGLVTVNGSGESATLVWFGSRVTLARLIVPYEFMIASEAYDAAPRRNFIDELNLDQLRTLRLAPSPRCDDAVFLRRSTIDTIGRLPTLEERDQFFADPPEQRRDRWIERLLASEDFVSYWSYKWSDMLLINGTRLRPLAVKSYYQWVRERVRENQPWDQFVQEVLTATGRSDENGATNFYALHQSPEEMTENACQAFMGLSIGCAKCHNHPLEKWTNDQYYAMANLFARVRAKGWGGDGRNGDGLRTLFVAASGDVVQPNRGRPQPPAPLDAPPIDIDNPGDRRLVLADWMTSPENPYFARAICNRVWANFFGRGLVEQVDDLRLSNPASNGPLLDALADHVVDIKFDLKQLMRTMLQSETYQRSSVAIDQNRPESKYHSRYYPRRLMAEVLLDSIDQVLGTTSTFNEIAFPGADKQKTDFYATGTKAIELYDASVNSYFLKTFGRNPREITCECERSAEPSMVQVLHLSNGDTLNPKLAAENNSISTAIASGLSDREFIDRLFLKAYSRLPQPDEATQFLAIIGEYTDDRRTGLEDATWSVLTNGEFTFNY